MSALTPSEALPSLRGHYADGRLIPFIGAGFSKPLGLPSWEDLIGSLAEALDFERDLFLLHGTFPQLSQYAEIKDSQAWGLFRHRMGVEFDSQVAQERRKSSIQHVALASLNWSTIYTTNFDEHIEGALRDAGKNPSVLATLRDFTKSEADSDCDVIKFHGTLSEPESIILSESRYFDRFSLEDPADQRLRSDIISNSFIFIGYSFSDENIRYIWYKINKLRANRISGGQETSLRPCYLISLGEDPVQSELLKRWGISMISIGPDDPSENIAELIRGIGA